MRHFAYLEAAEDTRLFYRPPVPFDRDSPAETLAMALGATLYSPATRPDLAADVRRQAAAGVASMVLCLEDAIADDEVPAAEDNVICQLGRLADESGGGDGPLLFVRVRTPEQVTALTARLGTAADVLTGYVLPKFSEFTGPAFLQAMDDAAELAGRPLLAMPVLETADIASAETRLAALGAIARLLGKYRDLVLAVRIGATDLCGLYGLRRNSDLTIYDITVAAGIIADIVNVLGRTDGTGFTVTGPVWEYFESTERLFKPQLRRSPFAEHDELRLREQLLSRDLDGLIREVALDLANGLTGKTVIHPSHVTPVHALHVVTREEYTDALAILGRDGGGVMRSEYANKMNEARPHRAWADGVLRRAEAYGVAADGVTFVDLLAAGKNCLAGAR
jgi:citrate lyase beta subunit